MTQPSEMASAAASLCPARAKAASARPFVAIEMSVRGETLLFDEPVDVVTANEFEEVGLLSRASRQRRHGYHLAGYAAVGDNTAWMIHFLG